jgi:hypothetical protein
MMRVGKSDSVTLPKEKEILKGTEMLNLQGEMNKEEKGMLYSIFDDGKKKVDIICHEQSATFFTYISNKLLIYMWILSSKPDWIQRADTFTGHK